MKGMTKLAFKDTDSFMEIDAILKSSNESTTILWQNKEESKRVVYGISKLKYNETIQTVQFYVKDYDYDMEEDKVVYIKLSFRQTVFKGEIVSIEGNVVTIYFPKDVKAQELRSSPRKEFRVKDEKNVILKIAPKASSDKSIDLIFKVLDISREGICLVVSDNNRQYLKNTEKHLLTHLGEIELPEGVFLELKYIQKYRYRHLGQLYIVNRAGFQLVGAFDQAHYSDFMEN
jgi:hypothetical protein